MSKHYLAIHHESYDSTTVYGVFDTFLEARDHLEAEAAKPDAYTSATWAEVQEWDGPLHTATIERYIVNPKIWNESWRLKGLTA